MSVIYRKIVKTSSLCKMSSQQVVNLMTLDSQKLYDSVLYAPFVIINPVVFLVCSVSLWAYLKWANIKGTGLSALVPITVAAYLIVFPVLYVVMRLCSMLKSRVGMLSCRRMSLIQEMLAHIRNIKMAALEILFTQNITESRSTELGFTKQVHIYSNLSLLIIHIVSIITLLGMAFTYRLQFEEEKLEFSVLLPIILLMFCHSKDLLVGFWFGLQSLSDAHSVLDRVKSIMLLEDVFNLSEKPKNPLLAVDIIQGNFTWESSRIVNIRKSTKSKNTSEENKLPMDELLNITLKDINFQAPKGKLIGVCGNTGSGKSSLLLAILGQLQLRCGDAMRQGTCAYVSQRPWIWNTTLKENIVFKELFDSYKYYNALELCYLNDDISGFPGFDETHIGDMKLSLGQKQRVALARAVYACRDIYILDNPLNCVNIKMAGSIFEKCILNELMSKGKTIILATHQIQFLNRCDQVYLLDKGEIIAEGSHDQLLHDNSPYSQIIKKYMEENAKKYNMEEENHYGNLSSIDRRLPSVSSVSSRSVHNVHDSFDEDENDRLMHVVQSHPINIYLRYIKNSSDYFWLTFAFILYFLGCVCIAGTPAVFLKEIGSFSNDNSTRGMYIINIENISTITKVAFLPIIVVITSLIWIFIFTKVALGISQNMHDCWISQICKASVLLFQQLPLSDFLKFFSINMYEIDINLLVVITTVIEKMAWIVTGIIIVGYAQHWLCIPLIIFIIICAIFTGFYRSGMLKVQELEELSRTPIHKHVITTLKGRTMIEAFAKTKEFVSEFTTKCDSNAACVYVLSAANRWLAFWIQIITVLVLLVTLVLCVELGDQFVWYIVAMIYLLQFGDQFHLGLRAVVEAEARLKKLAGVNLFLQGIKSEQHGSRSQSTLITNWPTNGNIEFRKVKVRYWPGVPETLNGLSFKIENGERIGIIGKPGSGKRPIINALFRVIELTQGSIWLGDVNIAQVPLNKLRSSISIVPQDPVLFSGTIRLNIDPDGKYEEKDILEKLKNTGLLETVALLPGVLQTRVSGTSNILSTGERQLLWLTRAALSNTKVLIIEESLSAIGRKIEKKIEKALNEVFRDCTVLIVAHRFTYVSHCDKVMVIDDGQVVEFDAPTLLYRNPKSNFSQMVGNNFETEF